MDKLKILNGLVVTNQDVDYVQSSIEKYFVDTLSVTSDISSFLSAGAIALGYDLQIIGSDIQVYNSNIYNLGYAVDKNGTILKYTPPTSSGILFTPADYTLDKVWVVSTHLQIDEGSYNPITDSIDIGVQNRAFLTTGIPGNSGTFDYDRLIQTSAIQVNDLATFTTLQTSSGNLYIELGRFTTDGTTITPNSIDLSNVSYLSALIRPNSITEELLEPLLKEAVAPLFVQLDYPSLGRVESGSNKFLFLDTTHNLSNAAGTSDLTLKDAELLTPDPVALIAPNGITGTRIIKYNHVSPLLLTDQAITGTFGNITDASNPFTIIPATDNFNVDYPFDIKGASFYISSIVGGVGVDTIDVRIVRTSDSVVMSTGSLQKNQITVGQVNIFPMVTTTLLSSNVAYTLEIKRSGGLLAVQIKGNSLGDFLFRVWFQPPVGKYASRNSTGSVQLFDQFGALEISNPSRPGLRYIPYAADIPDLNTFTPYTDLDNSVSRQFVAIDVTRGRYVFSNSETPLGDTYVACNFYILHKEVNASKVQRNSRDSEYFYESVDSALDRLSKITQVYLLVHRIFPDLIRDLPLVTAQKYHALSQTLNLTDSAGNFLSLNQGQLPSNQLKIDRYYLDATGALPLSTTFQAPLKSSGYLHYNANVISDTDKININGLIYEFDDNNIISGGSIKVDISGLLTNDARIGALVSAINTNDTSLTATQDIPNSKVKMEYNTYGALGNYVDFFGVTDLLSVMTYFAADDTTPNPLTLTDGTMGTYIEFSPRFTNQYGLILKADTSIYSIGNTYDVQVELWGGTYSTPTGVLAIGLFSGATVLNGGNFLIQTPWDLLVGNTYHYRILLTNVVGAGALSIAKQAAGPGNNEDLWYQEIFTDLGLGSGKLTVDFDVFDSTGSLFQSSLLRSPLLDNTNFGDLDATPSVTDYQVQSAINEVTDLFPVFVPTSLEAASVSKFHILVSEWDASDPLQTLTVTLHDNTNNVIGTPVTTLLTALQGPNGGFPLQTAVPPATTNGIDTGSAPYTVGNSREVVLPYVTPPLDLNKTYHLHLTTTGASANLFVATDGTLPGVNNKIYKQFYSPVFIPLTIELDDLNYGNIDLPSAYYVAVDVTRNRFQFHPSAPFILTTQATLKSSYYFKSTFDQLTSESVPRPDGSVVEDSLLFLDKTQHNGVLMMKRVQEGDLVVETGYIAATLEDTTFAGNITFEPDSDLFLFQKRNAPFLFWVLSGLAVGWDEEYEIGSGTNEYPQYKTYTNGVEIIRVSFLYNPNGSYSTLTYEYSGDSGATYTTLGTRNYTYVDGYVKSITWS